MNPSAIDAEPRDPPAVALEPLERIEHGLVLGRHRDDVIAALAAARRAAPLIARLFDSVAPLVKTISPAVAPMSAATVPAGLVDGLVRACQP